jgi:hypothetical protein
MAYVTVVCGLGAFESGVLVVRGRGLQEPPVLDVFWPWLSW